MINIFSVLVDISVSTRQYYWCRYQSSSKILNSIYWIIISKIRTFSSKMKFLSKEKKRFSFSSFPVLSPLSLPILTLYLLSSLRHPLVSPFTNSFIWLISNCLKYYVILWVTGWWSQSFRSRTFLCHREFRHILLHYYRHYYYIRFYNTDPIFTLSLSTS